MSGVYQPALLVVTAVGNAESSEGSRIAAEFQGCLGQELPLGVVPDLEQVRRTLLDAYPYAAPVIDQVIRPLAGCAHVRVPPTILMGSSACGKSCFAVALTGALGLPVEVVSCAGGALMGGNARQWATGEPCVPLSLIRRYHHAGPAIVLDALDAAPASQAPGALFGALQALLDPEAARRFRDPYLESPVDVSSDVSVLPKSIRERCRILRFPEPRAEDLQALANAMLRRLASRLGLHPLWATPLGGVELNALANRWRGGSLLHLEPYVEVVLSARGLPCEQH